VPLEDFQAQNNNFLINAASDLADGERLGLSEEEIEALVTRRDSRKAQQRYAAELRAQRAQQDPDIETARRRHQALVTRRDSRKAQQRNAAEQRAQLNAFTDQQRAQQGADIETALSDMQAFGVSNNDIDITRLDPEQLRRYDALVSELGPADAKKVFLALEMEAIPDAVHYEDTPQRLLYDEMDQGDTGFLTKPAAAGSVPVIDRDTGEVVLIEKPTATAVDKGALYSGVSEAGEIRDEIRNIQLRASKNYVPPQGVYTSYPTEPLTVRQAAKQLEVLETLLAQIEPQSVSWDNSPSQTKEYNLDNKYANRGRPAAGSTPAESDFTSRWQRLMDIYGDRDVFPAGNFDAIPISDVVSGRPTIIGQEARGVDIGAREVQQLIDEVGVEKADQILSDINTEVRARRIAGIQGDSYTTRPLGIVPNDPSAAAPLSQPVSGMEVFMTPKQQVSAGYGTPSQGGIEQLQQRLREGGSDRGRELFLKDREAGRQAVIADRAGTPESIREVNSSITGKAHGTTPVGNMINGEWVRRADVEPQMLQVVQPAAIASDSAVGAEARRRNQSDAAFEAKLLARNGQDARRRANEALEDIGQIVSLGNTKLGESEEIFRPDDAGTSNVKPVRTDGGNYVDLVEGNPIGRYGPELGPVPGLETPGVLPTTPTKWTTSDWVRGMQPVDVEVKGYPQVNIGAITEEFMTAVKTLDPERYPDLQNLPNDVRSPDEFTKIMDYISVQSEKELGTNRSKDKLLYPYYNEKGEYKPIKREGAPGAIEIFEKIGMKPARQRELANALSQLALADDTQVAKYNNRASSTIGVNFNSKEEMGDTSNVELQRFGKEKVDRKEITSGLKRLADEDAQIPFYGAIKGEVPETRKNYRGLDPVSTRAYFERREQEKPTKAGVNIQKVRDYQTGNAIVTERARRAGIPIARESKLQYSSALPRALPQKVEVNPAGGIRTESGVNLPAAPRQRSAPVVRRKAQPVVRRKAQPVVRREAQPVVRREVQPVVRREVQPVVRKAPENTQLINREIANRTAPVQQAQQRVVPTQAAPPTIRPEVTPSGSDFGAFNMRRPRNRIAAGASAGGLTLAGLLAAELDRRNQEEQQSVRSV